MKRLRKSNVPFVNSYSSMDLIAMSCATCVQIWTVCQCVG